MQQMQSMQMGGEPLTIRPLKAELKKDHDYIKEMDPYCVV